MRYWLGAMALAAMSVAAHGQDSGWGVFEAPDGSNGAGVQSSDGQQLILKCDKPGKNSVYAVVVTREPLVGATNNRFQMRPVEIRFDDKAPVEERWRFYEKSAVAINQKAEATLERLLRDLPDAQKLRVRFNPERGRWVEANFDVAGAKDAIAQVYEACQDETLGKA